MIVSKGYDSDGIPPKKTGLKFVQACFFYRVNQILNPKMDNRWLN